jgi:hypothetical protein
MYILVLAVIYWLIIEIKPKKTLGDEKQIFYNFIWYGEICITRTVYRIGEGNSLILPLYGMVKSV